MRDNRLHVVLGSKDERYVDGLIDALVDLGYQNPLVVKKGMKFSLEQYLKDNRDVDVLVVQEALESTNPFTIMEYSKYLDWNNALKIIPILTQETSLDKGKLVELYNNHIFLAAFGQIRFSDIALLIKNGRSRLEVRDFYGIAHLVDMQANVQDYESLIRFIMNDDGSSLETRLNHVRGQLSDKEFRIFLKKLPLEIIREIYEFPDYQQIIIECFPEEFGKLKKPRPEYEINMPRFKVGGLGEGSSATEDGDMSKPGMRITSPVIVDYLTAIKKVVIGFAGAQQHIGATFSCVAFAHYLSNNGYKVAVIEDASQANLSIHQIGKTQGDFFIHKGVTYYPGFNLEELHSVLLTADYNFLLIDFGLFRNEMIQEFNRCAVPMIVCGSKLWETPMINGVFDLVLSSENDLGRGQEKLASYNYLFTFTASAARRSILKNMGELKNVFFADYLENPFSGDGFFAMEKMIGSYLPVELEQRKESSLFTSLFSKRR